MTYRFKNKTTETSIETDECIEPTEGETIEEKIERIRNNKDGIDEGAETLYNERNEGVNPLTNVRTDRMELAIEASDKQTKAYLAQRQKREDATKEEKEQPKDGIPGKAKDQPGGKNQSGDPSQ